MSLLDCKFCPLSVCSISFPCTYLPSWWINVYILHFNDVDILWQFEGYHPQQNNFLQSPPPITAFRKAYRLTAAGQTYIITFTRTQKYQQCSACKRLLSPNLGEEHWWCQMGRCWVSLLGGRMLFYIITVPKRILLGVVSSEGWRWLILEITKLGNSLVCYFLCIKRPFYDYCQCSIKIAAVVSGAAKLVQSTAACTQWNTNNGSFDNWNWYLWKHYINKWLKKIK